MRAQPVIQLLAIAAVASALSGSEAALDLQLRLETRSGIFNTAGVTLRVSLHNRGREGVPAIVDPAFSPTSDGVRPTSLLTFEIRDGGGMLVAPDPAPRRMEAGLRPSQLLILNCGYFLGEEITLATPGAWRYTLRPGKYRARARLILATATFFKRKSALFDELVRHSGLQPEILQAMLPEGSLESEEVEFEVRQ